jgi:hypothetical protein
MASGKSLILPRKKGFDKAKKRLRVRYSGTIILDDRKSRPVTHQNDQSLKLSFSFLPATFGQPNSAAAPKQQQ